MTNLLQSSFLRHRRLGLRLEFVVMKRDEVETWRDIDVDPPVFCPKCNRTHPQLWVAWRKPVKSWGAWLVFRYLGEEHVPDLSVAISVPKPPFGAIKLTPDQNNEAWHKEDHPSSW